mmetsp:Transcript_26274/g.83461  ORF Transcript_26274/g.83461 Transcript_26274/m.83461 type:complete len:220 (-) Transcript_26274:713-1372(-)
MERCLRGAATARSAGSQITLSTSSCKSKTPVRIRSCSLYHTPPAVLPLGRASRQPCTSWILPACSRASSTPTALTGQSRRLVAETMTECNAWQCSQSKATSQFSALRFQTQFRTLMLLTSRCTRARVMFLCCVSRVERCICRMASASARTSVRSAEPIFSAMEASSPRHEPFKCSARIPRRLMRSSRPASSRASYTTTVKSAGPRSMRFPSPTRFSRPR